MTTRTPVALLASLVVFAAATTVRAQSSATPDPPARAAPRLTLGPPTAVPYRDGMSVPPGYHLEPRVRKGMVYTGAAIFGSLYLFSLTTLNNGEGNGKWNLIPIAGPALYARSVRCNAPCDDIGTPIFALFFTGGEAVGAALLAGGFFFQRPWLVPDQAQVASARRPTVTFLPRIDRLGASLAAIGTF